VQWNVLVAKTRLSGPGLQPGSQKRTRKGADLARKRGVLLASSALCAETVTLCARPGRPPRARWQTARDPKPTGVGVA
jgi:hypothetical protein